MFGFVRALIGCFVTRDYERPQTTSVLVQDLCICGEHASISCTSGNSAVVFTLLSTDADAYNRALHALQQFVHSKKPALLKYVETADKRYKLLTDVQEYIEDIGRDSKDSSRASGAFPVHMLLDSGLHFTYTFDHGEVYWIAVLRTGQYGNRYPVDERLEPVVRYKTMALLLEHKLYRT